MVMLKIILVVVLLSITFHVVMHLLAVFWDEVTRKAVEEIMKDPCKYVRQEHMIAFMRNMVYFAIVLMLTISAFQDKITIKSEKDNKTEVSVNYKGE